MLLAYKDAYVEHYAKYYNAKRKEFPWLESWIKKNGDPSEKRAERDTDAKKYDEEDGGASLIFILIIVLLVIGGIVTVNVAFKSFAFIVIGLITIVGSYLAGRILIPKMTKKATESALQKAKNLNIQLTFDPSEIKGASLECPSCHCPHSWGKVWENTQVEREKTFKKKIEFEHKYTDGSTSYSKSNFSTTTEYWGKEESDFLCENCGHKEHKVNANSCLGWFKKYYDGTTSDYSPKTGERNYNPPYTVWDSHIGRER